MEFQNLVKQVLLEHEKNATRPLNKFKEKIELEKILDLEITSEGKSQQQIEKFITDYFEYSVNTSHHHYTNQLWSKTEETSILGEFVSAVSNTSMYTYEVAPVATLLERKMIEHLSSLIWKEPSDGIMTSGGTASNLQALLVARNFHQEKVKSSGLTGLSKPLTILTAKNSHYSIKRSANILGIGHENLIEVPVNSQGQMEIDQIEKAYKQAKEKGLDPFCVVSTAGTTIEGSFDDLGTISQFCQRYKLWFHIDGAYGASVLLSSKYKRLMKGSHGADSLSWDFHKMLGLNLPCAFLFTKQKGFLKSSLSTQNDDYLFHEDNSLDLGPSSIQCGRKNDILKLWLNWMEKGSNGIESRVDKLFALSEAFSKMIEEHPDFSLVKKPQSINVLFRYQSSKIRLEEEIRNDLLKESKLMINYSKDSEGPFFRMAFTNPKLTSENLIMILEEIESVARRLK